MAGSRLAEAHQPPAPQPICVVAHPLCARVRTGPYPMFELLYRFTPCHGLAVQGVLSADEERVTPFPQLVFAWSADVHVVRLPVAHVHHGRFHFIPFTWNLPGVYLPLLM